MLQVIREMHDEKFPEQAFRNRERRNAYGCYRSGKIKSCQGNMLLHQQAFRNKVIMPEQAAGQNEHSLIS